MMLRFFRQIRKLLLEQNKTSTYLKYALGEVALVMIGILLALQVNNWNEDRKLRNIEIKLLKEMLVDLQDQHADVEFNMEHHLEGERSGRIVREALLNDLPFHDSLKTHFQQAYNFTILNNRRNAYNSLLSQGIDLISNDSLRSYISKYYEQGVPFQLEIQQVTVDLIRNTSVDHLELFKNMNWNSPLEPWDYESLKTNRKYIAWLEFVNNNKSFEANAFENLKINNEKLTKDIIEELKRLK